MAVTYGFYNSLNGDRKYNAEQMSAIFDGVITDGVFGSIGGALMTIAGEGMQVLVKTGKAWFNSTWTLNDAQMALPIDTADVSLTRIDAVVLEVNSGISTRENSIKVIKGTPSANPVKPTMASDEDLHQYALAYVTVAANATSITAANIEVNVGKTGCPFVTSVLQQTSITDLFAQWEAEFDTWFDNVQAQLAGDVATNLQLQIDALKIGKTAQKQYGLTSTYPNDYIEWLGKYNEYWWSLLHGEEYIVYEEKKTYRSIKSSPSEQLYITNYNWYDGASTMTIQYADEIVISQSDGTITLKDPVSATWSRTDSATKKLSYAKTLLGKYILGALGISNITSGTSSYTKSLIFWIPTDAEIIASDGNYNIVFNAFYSISAAAYAIPAGETTYEHSTDRNAYPDSGTVDGITYTYLGRPFEKFPTVPQIESGSYMGTGTYGESNPNSLTFFRKPSAVIIFSNDMSNGRLNTLSLVNPMTVAAALYYGANSNGYISGVDGGIVQVEWTDTGVKWYTLVSPSTNKHTLSQMNAIGIKYHYLILG